MEKIRLLFFIVGSALFGLGMILAGLVNIANYKYAAGTVYIISAILGVALLAFIFMYGNKKGKTR